MRLGAKLRVSYVGIVLIAVTIVLVLIVDNAQRELKEKIGRDLHMVAKLEAGNIDVYVKQRINEITKLAQKPVFKYLDITKIDTYINRLVQKDAGYDEVSVITPDGTVISSTVPGSAGNSLKWGEESSAVFFDKAARDRKGTALFRYRFSDPGEKRIKGIVLVPVIDINPVSVIMATINIDHLFKASEEIDSDIADMKGTYPLNTPATMIVTQDGEAQMFTPIVYIQPFSYFPHPRHGDISGYTIYRDRVRGNVIAGYSGLREYGTGEDAGWAVISTAPQKEVFSPAIRLRNRVIILGIIAVCVAWIISIFVARGITKPVTDLVAVTNLIAKGDLSHRANIRLTDEIGDLGKSFNKMTEKLNTAIVSRDQEIIERKNVEERLKEEMEDKMKFVSMISCEFRTPLTAIKEGIALVLKEISDKIDDRQKALLNLAKRSGESLSRLINDILNFHKLESEIVKFNLQENDINEVVKDVTSSMGPLLTEKRGVDLSVETDQNLPRAVFDKQKIALALTNIVNIAIRATEEGHLTIITAREGKNAVRVSVKDTSSEISEKDLPKLFHRFGEPGQSWDKKAGGSGMGLAIAAEIVEQHNGKIWAESKPGEGTTIHFVIPVVERRV